MPERPRFSFDLEGTLVDQEPWHQLAFAKVAEDFGVKFGKSEFLNFVGAGDKAISEEIARLADLHGNTFANVIRNIKNSTYRDILFSHEILPREAVAVYLDRAKTVGGDLVIASLTPRSDAEYILKSSGLLPFFRHVLTEEDVKELKPNPEVYLKSARLLKISPGKQLVHEDSPVGVKAAKNAGSPVVAFPVHKDLIFDPEPNEIILSWIGQNPFEIYNRATG